MVKAIVVFVIGLIGYISTLHSYTDPGAVNPLNPVALIVMIIGAVLLLREILKMTKTAKERVEYSKASVADFLLDKINSYAEVAVEVNDDKTIINEKNYYYSDYGYGKVSNPKNLRDYLFAHMERKKDHAKTVRTEKIYIDGGDFYHMGPKGIAKDTGNCYTAEYYQIIPKSSFSQAKEPSLKSW